MTTHDAARDAKDWFATPLGQYLLAREQAYFDNVVADVFGYNAFQLGMPDVDLLRTSRIPMRCQVDAAGPAELRADFRDLPIASNSVDLVLLPHTLEFLSGLIVRSGSRAKSTVHLKPWLWLRIFASMGRPSSPRYSSSPVRNTRCRPWPGPGPAW